MPESFNGISISPTTLRALVGLQQAVNNHDMDDFLLDMAAVYHDIHTSRLGTNLTVREFSCELMALYRVAREAAGRANAICEVTLEPQVDEEGKTTTYVTGIGTNFVFGTLRPIYEKAQRRKHMLRSVATTPDAGPAHS